MTGPFQSPSAHPELATRVSRVQHEFQAVLDNVEEVILGKAHVARRVLLGMMAGGHVLLEDVPGTGKTMLSRAVAACTRCVFKRIQFTPDLLPMDITGSNVFNLRSKAFEFQQGPVFTNLLLADEINRASPKTQAALLEVMAERQVTIEGVTHRVPAPFLVLATMNPLDHEGTYALPAAQLDRFSMQLSIGFPDAQDEIRMLEVHLGLHPVLDRLQPVISREALLGWQATVPLIYTSPALKRYVVALVNAARTAPAALAPPSPRATLMLVRVAQAHALSQGRDYVVPSDVAELAPDVLAHRLVISGERSPRAFVQALLEQVEVAA